jgi:integrase
MGRTVEDAPVTTAAARSRLSPGLHWRTIGPDVHLGYRKGVRGGRWVVRWREDAGYRQETIGPADDLLTADDVSTLSFHQACSIAARHVEEKRAEAVVRAAGPVPTVRSAVVGYCDAVEARQAAEGRHVLKDARSRLTKHVLSATAIADVELHVLRAEQIADWREGLRDSDLTPTSIRRICNDFRAALNEAGRAARSRLPAGYAETVRDGFAVTTRDGGSYNPRPNVILPDADVRLLLDAARAVDEEEGFEGDLFRIVLVLAATGARFSQVARMVVSDVQAAAGRVMVPTSRKGKSTGKRTHVAVAVGPDVLAALRPAMEGRKGHEPLLMRWGYKHVTRIEWVKDARRAWQPAELSKPFRKIVERAGLPADVSAYALRHSSIVRGLSAGLPVRLVASLHDTSSEMIEKHYSAWIADALGEVAARAVVPLIAPPADVIPIRR